jgi:hypothetical protein
MWHVGFDVLMCELSHLLLSNAFEGKLMSINSQILCSEEEEISEDS